MAEWRFSAVSSAKTYYNDSKATEQRLILNVHQYYVDGISLMDVTREMVNWRVAKSVCLEQSESQT